MELIVSYLIKLIVIVALGIASYIGIKLKNLYTQYINTKIKKDIAKTVVESVEQMFKDLKGPEKLIKATEWISSILKEKNINISDEEIRVLIESAVGEFNEVFKK